MNRIVTMFGVLVMFALLSSACTETPEPSVSVVTSLPVTALMVRPLLPPTVPVRVILPDGASPHGFEPRPSHAVALEGAAVVVAVHPHVDGWMTRLTSRAVYFMEADDPSGHAHDDAHMWMDPVRVRRAVPQLVQSLCEGLPNECASIRERVPAWTATLDSLHEATIMTSSQHQIRPLVTAQPFIHPLLERYGIPYIGPVQELPGQMASARRLSTLMDQVKQTGANTLVTQSILRDGGMNRFAAEMGLDVLLLEPVGHGFDRYEHYIDDLMGRIHAAR